MARRNQFFRAMDNVELAVNRRGYDRSKPRSLTVDDISDFDKAGDIRRGRKPTPANIAEVKRQLKKDNLVRYLRLQSDVRWARKRMKKMGRNPDDIWTVLGD